MYFYGMMEETTLWDGLKDVLSLGTERVDLESCSWPLGTQLGADSFIQPQFTHSLVY